MSIIRTLAADIINDAQRNGIKIVTAESCTGGLVSAALTDIAGSSTVFDRGFVTYSNESKIALLGVCEQTLDQHGAVSEHVARAMAEGALRNSMADLSIAITGIAGPGGGSEAKPIGLVHFASARKDLTTRHAVEYFGDVGRAQVRDRALHKALDMLRERLKNCD